MWSSLCDSSFKKFIKTCHMIPQVLFIPKGLIDLIPNANQSLINYRDIYTEMLLLLLRYNATRERHTYSFYIFIVFYHHLFHRHVYII